MTNNNLGGILGIDVLGASLDECRQVAGIQAAAFYGNTPHVIRFISANADDVPFTGVAHVWWAHFDAVELQAETPDA